MDDKDKTAHADEKSKAFQPKDENDYPGKMHFPAWRYNAKGEARIVNSQVEADALGKGWHENPNPEGQQEVRPRSDRSQADADATRDANERAVREDEKKREEAAHTKK